AQGHLRAHAEHQPPRHNQSYLLNLRTGGKELGSGEGCCQTECFLRPNTASGGFDGKGLGMRHRADASEQQDRSGLSRSHGVLLRDAHGRFRVQNSGSTLPSNMCSLPSGEKVGSIEQQVIFGDSEGHLHVWALGENF
ncbi:unnamed protein product, partial [Ascophyllum nodosum]